MAVARIKATKRWHKKAAGIMQDVPKAARELNRAAERPGLLAEMHADEMRILIERMPNDPLVKKAFGELREAEICEAARPSARDVALGNAQLWRARERAVELGRREKR